MTKSNTDDRVVLFWTSSPGRDQGTITIEGEEGTITPAQARSLWTSGQVKNCNAAFNRLAYYDFDVKTALESYDET